MIKNSLKRIEILRSKKIIDKVYESKNKCKSGPLLGSIINSTEKKIPQVLFSAGKKKIKHAYLRNRIKRKMREAYRLNKKSFFEKAFGKNIALAIFYCSDKEYDYKKIENNIIELLKYFTTKI